MQKPKSTRHLRKTGISEGLANGITKRRGSLCPDHLDLNGAGIAGSDNLTVGQPRSEDLELGIQGLNGGTGAIGNDDYPRQDGLRNQRGKRIGKVGEVLFNRHQGRNRGIHLLGGVGRSAIYDRSEDLLDIQCLRLDRTHRLQCTQAPAHTDSAAWNRRFGLLTDDASASCNGGARARSYLPRYRNVHRGL